MSHNLDNHVNSLPSCFDGAAEFSISVTHRINIEVQFYLFPKMNEINTYSKKLDMKTENDRWTLLLMIILFILYLEDTTIPLKWTQK